MEGLEIYALTNVEDWQRECGRHNKEVGVP